MDKQLLANAKKDIPLYFEDFKRFWKATEIYFTDEDLVECYHNSLIFKNWLLVLNHVGVNSLDSILLETHEDINASFFHAYFGHYRSSHMHLRSVIELSLQLIYFFQHEVEYGQWKNADFRIKHDELTGYLKKHPNFVDTSAISLIEDITRSWKLYSKYIHAEAPTFFQTNLQSTLTKAISPADFGVWKSNYLKTGYQINRIFFIFFRDKVNLFPSASKDILTKRLKSHDLIELGIA